ncbi:MAG: EAL domain-containing protein [Methyloprofundus sp.]|nr:EAL domain-containing protein [Methyloprofundus sp.]
MKVLDRLNISHKILMLSGFLIGLMFFLGVIFYSHLFYQKNVIEELVDHKLAYLLESSAVSRNMMGLHNELSSTVRKASFSALSDRELLLAMDHYIHLLNDLETRLQVNFVQHSVPEQQSLKTLFVEYRKWLVLIQESVVQDKSLVDVYWVHADNNIAYIASEFERVERQVIKAAQNNFMLTSQYFFQFGLFFVGIFCLSIFIAYYFSRSIVRPINYLAVKLSSISSQLDLNQSVQIHSQDELRVLADAFNRIIKQLKMSYDRWDVLNSDLELKVERRTEEISASNEKLKDEIKERKQAESYLRDSEKSFRSLFEYSGNAVILIEEGVIIDCNMAALKMLDYTDKAELLNITPADISPVLQLDGQASEDKAEKMIAMALTRGFHHFEWMHRKKDDSVIPVEVVLTSISMQGVDIIYASLKDITEQKQAENQINQLAFFDSLTQLPNRHQMLKRIKLGVLRARHEKTQLAVLMLDLDHFKPVNDQLGHQAGDELLQQVAIRIFGQLKASDLVARFGGDEFVILLEDTTYDEVGRVANKIVEALAVPFELTQSDDVRISASIGGSLYPQHGDSVEKLMANADMALYQVKEKGRGCFTYFSDYLTEAAESKLKIELKLRNAIELQQLCMFYQPQVECLTGEVVGLEALVRWEDPEKGLVFPDEFIGIAEESGLIISLGEWVLREVCRQGEEWLAKGIAPVRLAVNISEREFMQPSFFDSVKNILLETQFPAKYLELEISENCFMGYKDKAIYSFRELHSLGVGLVVDNFGTGCSSLAHLNCFSLNALKIDKSLIDGISCDGKDREFVVTVIAIAKVLRLQVVAEGVETAKQLEFLKQHECDIYQGYIQSKALNLADIEKVLLAGVTHSQ